MASNNNLQAQKENHDYIPLLDTNKTWTEAMRGEFGGFGLTTYYIQDTVTYNDTLYYTLNECVGCASKYLREDTTAKKVYYSGYYPGAETGGEGLLYDFSMEVGDSILLNDGYYHLLEDKQIENIFGVERFVYYLSWYEEMGYIIWIEGIGSLAGIFENDESPSLMGMGTTELNCSYHNDLLIYQSNSSSIYGCNFEIDPYPPVIEQVFGAYNSTVFIDEYINISIYIYDEYIYMGGDMNDLNIEMTFVTPNGNNYYFSDFTYYAESIYWYGGQIQGFNNEVGHWYLSNIYVEDLQNNVTEVSYTLENTPIKFYVQDTTTSINKIINNKFLIFPNPAEQFIFINVDNINALEYTIKICNIFGKTVRKESKKNKNDKRIAFDISEYQSGIYFIKIIADNKILFSNKFLKK